ncbi:hypothetical protein AUJ77_01480 [Candidatus Nomurabacteria bacterium CG1_02_43_90]|uniref:Aminotransferase class V domain-containing protein n=1 Tax=Candidatus Nomurabacteria bacterium CG1_02_43_90 TaxID=1805281 RepID=A0A1J4V9E4_9BACT|nr:MAG: hypothetical protein AUJ77_01480 [Candidatus Nomurabacteria bacterium CG1_02_43_90]
MRRIYLDHVAATPVSDTALRAMTTAMEKFPGNPSAIHTEGREARGVLEKARAEIAGAISAHSDEIVFTSGATEANNMAIVGVVRSARANGVKHPHIIVSTIEHPSVLEVAHALEKEEVKVSYLPVNHFGVVSPRTLRTLITPETVLVSVMYANNEIGTIEPVIEIAKEIRHARKMNKTVYPYFHTDAVQAVNYCELNVQRLGVDLMTISSGKIYGPRGIGALFVKRGVLNEPIFYGGEQEESRRAGTESVALAVGFSVAFAEARKMSAQEFKRVKKLRDTLTEQILKKVPGVFINGDLENSLPNILNLSLEGVESEALLLYLDAVGVALSGKSACKSSDSSASHVIMALDKQNEENTGSIRFSLGRETKSADIVYVVKEFLRIVPFLRTMNKQSDTI